MRRTFAASAALALALSVSLSACATEAPATQGLADAIAISYRPVPLSPTDSAETRVGRLIYRGGLELNAPDARFGGWSGLVVSKDGKRLLSQSDDAHWLRADLIYDKDGNLVGIDHAQLADMLGLKGEKLTKHSGDAEGLDALDGGPDGSVLVSFEQTPKVWRYDLSHSLDVTPQPVAMPDSIAEVAGNQGLEGLAVLSPREFFTVAESPHRTKGEMDAWLIPYPIALGGPQGGRLHVARHAPYEISDAALGPDGRYLYLLERHYFGPIGGIVIAVRQIDIADVKPGAVLEGHEIAEFTMRETIDNMEGLALRRGADGKTLLYMISDDNYSSLQKTLLMMFELAPQ